MGVLSYSELLAGVGPVLRARRRQRFLGADDSGDSMPIDPDSIFSTSAPTPPSASDLENQAQIALQQAQAAQASGVPGTEAVAAANYSAFQALLQQASVQRSQDYAASQAVDPATAAAVNRILTGDTSGNMNAANAWLARNGGTNPTNQSSWPDSTATAAPTPTPAIIPAPAPVRAPAAPVIQGTGPTYASPWVSMGAGQVINTTNGVIGQTTGSYPPGSVVPNDVVTVSNPNQPVTVNAVTTRTPYPVSPYKAPTFTVPASTAQARAQAILGPPPKTTLEKVLPWALGAAGVAGFALLVASIVHNPTPTHPEDRK